MTTNEIRLAEEILSVLPKGTWARNASDDRDILRYVVRSGEMKLRSVVLKRSSLQRLLADPQREVKIEYLKRDLLRTARRRAEFRYPREIRQASSPKRLLRSLRVAVASAL